MNHKNIMSKVGTIKNLYNNNMLKIIISKSLFLKQDFPQSRSKNPYLILRQPLSLIKEMSSKTVNCFPAVSLLKFYQLYFLVQMLHPEQLQTAINMKDFSSLGGSYLMCD